MLTLNHYFLTNASLRLRAGHLIHGHGSDDNRANDDELHVRGNAQQRAAVPQESNEQGADDRA